MRQGTGLRVVVFDRGMANPYSRGLARGLENVGVRVVLAGPNCADRSHGDPEVVAVYPRGDVRGQKGRKAADAVVGAARLTRLVASFQPDILHFQWGASQDYAIARVLKSVTRAKVVFTVHDPVARGGASFQKRLVRAADTLIVHGPLLREALLRQYDVRPERVYVVPHGHFEHAVVRYPRAQARKRLSLREDGPVFTYVGQLVPRKGLETLMDAFRLHCERGRAGTLVVVGATYGVDESQLRARVAGHEQRVRWMTRPEGVPAAYIDLAVSAATQVVLPFYDATQSGSVLYAMTHGRCVVTTNTGEIPATVREHGIIVPPRDPVALEAALELAVLDPERCDLLGADARSHVLHEFDWTDIASQTVAAYRAARELTGGDQMPIASERS